MSRGEFTFRVWNGKTMSKPMGLGAQGLRFRKRTDVVMQSVDRKDKNEIDIFEGDWLKFESDEGPFYEEVFWSKQDGAWRIRDKYGSSSLALSNEDAIVAGNIYENPDMLK